MPIYTPTSPVGGTSCTILLLILNNVRYFDFCQSYRCEIMSYCCFNLQFPAHKWAGMSSLTFIGWMGFLHFSTCYGKDPHSFLKTHEEVRLQFLSTFSNQLSSTPFSLKIQLRHCLSRKPFLSSQCFSLLIPIAPQPVSAEVPATPWYLSLSFSSPERLRVTWGQDTIG